MSNVIPIYDPRTMDPAVQIRRAVQTTLRDRFFPETKTYVTEQVDMDYRKGGMTVAPFVAPKIGGINIDRSGYQTRSYKPPLVAPQRVLNPDVLQPRLPGETVHSAMSPEQRQEYYLQQDAQELDDMISRREEVMCAQCLTTGIITVKGYSDENLSEYIEDDVDYNFTQKAVLTGNARWNQTTSTKYADLELGCEAIRKAGYNPTDMIIGATAWQYLRADEDFQALLDLRWAQFAAIAPQYQTVQGSGIQYIGDLPDLGVKLWRYVAWYTDLDGTIKPYIPEDHVVILPGPVGHMKYGAVTQIEADKRFHTYEGTRIPKLLINENANTAIYRQQSRPLPVPVDLDSWYVIDTITAS